MMTLKSIELASFKSFGKKSLLSLTSPVTCVVGPNGSGKSNIVEAFRFVLGEQSMKSLRGKGGVDLIFKGSKTLSSANRAHVSITFDNSSKIFSFTNSGLGISLEYDEVTISREVFADGSNRYSINSTEVRLKDIVDLLSSVNIGSSGHHIISQGEADRVLNASNKDRRIMIEDALGLKVYQFRIQESSRKLDKTLLNVKEVQALRREIAPHVAFLKKQVQVVEKATVMREELRAHYQSFFSAEATFVESETKRLLHEKRRIDEEILSLDERIAKLQSVSENNTTTPNLEYKNRIRECEAELVKLRSTRDELTRGLGRIEGVVESIERELSRVPEHKESLMRESEWKEIIHGIQSRVDEALNAEELPVVLGFLRSIKEHLNSISPSHDVHESNAVEAKASLLSELEEMKNSRSQIIRELEELKSSEQGVLAQIAEIRREESAAQAEVRDSERVLYELMRERTEVGSRQKSMHFEEEKLALIKNNFEKELAEGGAIIGRDVLSYAHMRVEGRIDRSTQEELIRKIERIKIKLEDNGGINGAEVMKEYEDTVARDSFLAGEIDDLNKSIDHCRILIQELKEKLDTEFKVGVEKINKQFQEFFSLMFGGGSAFLSVVMDHKKSRKISKEEEEISEDGEESADNELGFERGIEINITLPQKKVKDLHMLSGGERSLTSIALLFAISQVNPPPFLVLDETDAALDEANSRKYGNMLESLSKYSQLIVVTHNRETMSRAQVLYGVTMDASGASKLLSIALVDATTYAK
jgi:chromosome segregation protein